LSLLRLDAVGLEEFSVCAFRNEDAVAYDDDGRQVSLPAQSPYSLDMQRCAFGYLLGREMVFVHVKSRSSMILSRVVCESPIFSPLSRAILFSDAQALVLPINFAIPARVKRWYFPQSNSSVIRSLSLISVIM